MNSVEARFYPSVFAVRADLDDAHRRTWQLVSSVGGWFNAQQRRMIAAVACVAFNEIEPSAPWIPASSSERIRAQVEAMLGAPLVLEPALVDATFRMTAHAASITETWFAQLTSNGLAAQAYVELCGLIVSVSAVCSFARTIGAPLPPLPPAFDNDAPTLVEHPCDRSRATGYR